MSGGLIIINCTSLLLVGCPMLFSDQRETRYSWDHVSAGSATCLFFQQNTAVCTAILLNVTLLAQYSDGQISTVAYRLMRYATL